MLLDDVLSAVDTQTARHLVAHALCGPLSRGRTFILATHAVYLCMAQAAFAVHLDGGNIVKSGQPEAILQLARSLPSVVHDHHQAPHTPTTLPNREGDKTGSADSTKLIKDEHQEEGAVKLNVYKAYASAFGATSQWLTALGLFVLAQGFQIASNISLRNWAAASYIEPEKQLAWFIGLSALMLLFIVGRTAYSLVRPSYGHRWSAHDVRAVTSHDR